MDPVNRPIKFSHDDSPSGRETMRILKRIDELRDSGRARRIQLERILSEAEDVRRSEMLSSTRAYQYGDIWMRERTTGPVRLVIGPNRDHVSLLGELSAVMRSPFGLLYVLLVERGTHRAGRYQSSQTASEHELRVFFDTFRDYLECDGRHHLWVCSASQPANLLVYDNHNVIYAYGLLDEFETVLLERGFRETDFGFPAPHTHHYNREFDLQEDELFRWCDWIYSPLQPDDDPYGTLPVDDNAGGSREPS